MHQEDRAEPEVINLDSSETKVSELDQYLTEVSLFAYRRVVIIKHPVWLEKSRTGERKEYEAIIKSFAQRSPSQIHLLLTSTKSPSGTIAKVIKKSGNILEIPNLDARQMSSWITSELRKSGLKIDKNALNQLVKSRRDMNYVAREIERLALCHREQTITLSDLTGIELDLTSFNIFRMTDALLRKNTREALKALALLMEKGEAITLMVHMITRELILLAKVQALSAKGESRAEIARSLGIQSFRIDKMMGSAVDHKELKKTFDQLAAVDYALKNTAQDEQLLLETMVVEICER